MEDTEQHYKWWTFTVFFPGETAEDEDYEYTESEQGLTLEDAKAKYRENNPEGIILAGGEEEDY